MARNWGTNPPTKWMMSLVSNHAFWRVFNCEPFAYHMSLYSPLSLISAPWHQFCSGCVPLSTTDTAALEPKAVHSSGWLPHPVENGALKTPSVGPCALWIGCTWLYFGFAPPYKFLATLESRLLPFHILPSHTAFFVPSHFFLSSLLLFLKQSRVPIIGLPGPNCLLPHPHSQSSSKITCKKRQSTSTSTSTSSVSNFNHQHELKSLILSPSYPHPIPIPSPPPAPPGPNRRLSQPCLLLLALLALLHGQA